MTTAVWTDRVERVSAADTALKIATRSWFAVAVVGQLIFAFAVGSFYSLTALRGDYHGWSKFITHGHVPGDTAGNLAVALHIAAAVLVLMGGALQLIPSVRSRFPVFHRWNGRVYLLSAVTIAGAGLYMTWVRGSIGDLSQHLGSTVNALLIWFCAGMALRTAIARDFRSHRRWALRLFLVASAAWFYRIAFFLVLLLFQGPVGFDPTTFEGPLPTVMAFAQFLVPLAVLELYLRAQARPGVLRRMATAALLCVLTLAMAAGIFAVSLAVWVPDVRAAFDARTSIAAVLSDTLASGGLDAAVQRYHQLKGAAPKTYNFDVGQLNGLGYELLHQKKEREAIRIFQLNTEAYPHSSNAYDSLGEAYLGAGDRSRAIVSYRKAVELDPHNANAKAALRKLEASGAGAR